MSLILPKGQKTQLPKPQTKKVRMIKIAREKKRKEGNHSINKVNKYSPWAGDRDMENCDARLRVRDVLLLDSCRSRDWLLVTDFVRCEFLLVDPPDECKCIVLMYLSSTCWPNNEKTKFVRKTKPWQIFVISTSLFCDKGFYQAELRTWTAFWIKSSRKTKLSIWWYFSDMIFDIVNSISKMYNKTPNECVAMWVWALWLALSARHSLMANATWKCFTFIRLNDDGAWYCVWSYTPMISYPFQALKMLMPMDKHVKLNII